MASERSSAKRERFELAGDAAVVTAAVLAVLTSIVLLVSAGVGDREVPVAIQLASALAVLLGGIAGPVVAWLMHGRRITLPAVLGGIVGAAVSGAAFAVFVAFSTALGWVLSPLTDAEWAGPLAGLVLVAVAFVVLVVWLLFDAVRDYARPRRRHRSLDILRILSTIVIATYSVVITVLAFAGPGGEIVEALAFMLIGAVNGALVVTMADFLVRLIAPKPEGPTVSPV
jgi:hypothetical protein